MTPTLVDQTGSLSLSTQMATPGTFSSFINCGVIFSSFSITADNSGARSIFSPSILASET